MEKGICKYLKVIGGLKGNFSLQFETPWRDVDVCKGVSYFERRNLVRGLQEKIQEK